MNATTTPSLNPTRRAWLLAALLAPLAGRLQAQTDVSAELQMAAEAAPSRAVADAFSARAMASEREAVIAMLSPALVARIGDATIARVVDTQILPFFRGGRAVGRSTTVARTTDATGAGGFAFYQWLEAHDGSAPRPFTLYVVKEQGRWVVANVVPGRMVAGRHQ